MLDQRDASGLPCWLEKLATCGHPTLEGLAKGIREDQGDALDTEEYAYSGDFMCDRLGVPRSGYYDWRSRPESATAQRREEL
ncbi:hypothetical protein [Streptomyces sp. NBC_01451]|uniref:hypothetical protein n=1 Tax=Streptomyces sp. NBC_01451 TaxID=2903872 RepID=UPI002E324ACF|nr:hypothetical protein [Streptomyces sp. NBC_01451]